MISDGTFSEFECALSDDRHFINRPITLPSCGHSVCKICLPKESNSIIKCKLCGEITTRDLSRDKEAIGLKSAFKRNIKDLFPILEKQMRSQINRLKNCKEQKLSSIEVKIEYIRDEIEIRIESLKNNLEKLSEALKNELEEIKKDLIKSCNSSFNEKNVDVKEYEKSLEKLRSDIEKKLTQDEGKFYDYQDDLKKLNNLVKSVLDQDFYKLNIKIPDGLKKHQVAKIIYKNQQEGYNLNASYREKLKKGDFNIIDINTRPFDSCILPNNLILFANRDDKKLTLCDNNFKTIKSIVKIQEKPFYPESIAVDGDNNRFYLTNRDSHEIIMTDLEFQKIKSYGALGSGFNQLNDPCGICIANDNVYVCDSKNKRIQILNTDLEFVNSITLDYEPWLIKASNELVCIERNDGRGIDFYNLEDFSFKCNYNHGWGKISAIDSYFYECCPKAKKIYCYDRNANLIEELKIDRFDNLLSNSWDGYLMSMDNKLLMLSYNKRKIIQFY